MRALGWMRTNPNLCWSYATAQGGCCGCGGWASPAEGVQGHSKLRVLSCAYMVRLLLLATAM